jgi:DNA-binding LacI/PurR family transcriptional regulator
MGSNRIYVCGEPIHQNTLWYTITTQGIFDCAAGHKAEVVFFKESQLEATIKELPDKHEPIIIIGASIPWLNDIYNRLSSTSARTILLGTNEQLPRRNSCVITLNHREATWDIVHYLHSAGRRRLTFFGFNPRSLNDKAKREGLLAAAESLQLDFNADEDVYFNAGNLEACFQNFLPKIKSYDAAICTNDLPAVSLIQRAMTMGVRVPENLYVISYGNTLLSRLVTPTLTSTTLNYGDTGRHAVDSYFYLRQNPDISSQLIALSSTIAVRASTGYYLSPSNYIDKQKSPVTHFHNSGFFDDPFVKRMMRIEDFFNAIDAVDMKILAALLDGEKYADIIRCMFISDSMLRYRIRKMEQLIGAESRKEMIDKVSAITCGKALMDLANGER